MDGGTEGWRRGRDKIDTLRPPNPKKTSTVVQLTTKVNRWGTPQWLGESEIGFKMCRSNDGCMIDSALIATRSGKKNQIRVWSF